jgi:hypothetical protein
VERAEQQLRLIRAVYRVESVRHSGKDLAELRARCDALLDSTLALVDGDMRLEDLLADIRRQINPV